jgi:DNA-binding transcriptional LysR family regulator
MQAMDWDDLRIFLAVARSGRLAGAAVMLGLDATTVGRRLRRFEQALDATLFENQREGQRLTQAGERLLAQAEQVERVITALDADRPATGAISGLVRISAPEGFGTRIIAPHLHIFAARHPAILVDLFAASGFLSPTKRETDIAILLARPRRGPLVSRPLARYRLRLYAARTYLADALPVAAPADLRRHPLVGYMPDFVYAPELDYLDEILPDLTPRLRSSSIDAQYRMLLAGAGIGVLPCFMGDADPALARVLPALAIERTFWLVTHQDLRDMARIRATTDWLGELTDRLRVPLTG